jgi:L-alanine-DL-glutamate epimerase-like enolase superfamily enzyme
MQLHVGRAIANFYMAEHDPLTNDVILARGYEIKDGGCSVPPAPGFGLAVNEAKFRSHAKIRFDLTV